MPVQLSQNPNINAEHHVLKFRNQNQCSSLVNEYMDQVLKASIVLLFDVIYVKLTSIWNLNECSFTTVSPLLIQSHTQENLFNYSRHHNFAFLNKTSCLVLISNGSSKKWTGLRNFAQILFLYPPFTPTPAGPKKIEPVAARCEPILKLNRIHLSVTKVTKIAL